VSPRVTSGCWILLPSSCGGRIRCERRGELGELTEREQKYFVKCEGFSNAEIG